MRAGRRYFPHISGGQEPAAPLPHGTGLIPWLPPGHSNAQPSRVPRSNAPARSHCSLLMVCSKAQVAASVCLGGLWVKLGFERKLGKKRSKVCIQEKTFDLAGPKDQKMLEKPQNPLKVYFFLFRLRKETQDYLLP